MNEKKDEMENDEVETPKKNKKGSKSLILIIIIAVAVLAGGGSAFFFLTKSGNGEKTPKKSEEQRKKEESAMFALDPFVVNLNDQSASKFLKVSMQLELSNQADLESVKAKTPQIRDVIINILTSKTADSLMSPEGKLQLKDEINMQINQILGNNTVKNVYLTEFVMQ